MAIQEVLVSKIFNYTSEPTKKIEGQFWFNPSTNVLSRYTGTVWKPITVGSDDVAVLSDGSKISLTNYLNTQIAALAEGIDSKQDKLSYYTEVSGAAPSATISVVNINLNGKVAEGNYTTASGEASHAEGQDTNASGYSSHAEGYSTTASGDYSHAEGYNTTASAFGSHAEGRYTTASSDFQHVQGRYNIEDANNKYADIIGNGSEDHGGSNAQTVSWTGITWSQTDVRAGGTDQDSAIHSLSNKQNKLETYKERQGASSINTTISSLVDDDGMYTGDIIISTTGAVSSPGNITLSTGTTGGGGASGSITLTTGDESNSSAIGAASLVLDKVSNGGSITLKAGEYNQSNITLESVNGNLALDVRNITGSAVDTTISSSSTDSHIPTSKAVYDATAALSEGINNKQDKLNFYSEEGEGYLAEANISNTAHINFNAHDPDGGGQINITSSSSAPVTSDITLEARSNSSMTYSKIVLDSGTSTSPASITIDGELTGSAISTSIPTSDAVDTKVTSEKAVKTELDKKQDKLKFYSEVDKSDDTSSDSTGSEINLETLASQYGGSKINIFASQGESTSGKINLTSQAYSESADGGVITLLSDGVRGDGGEITLKAKTVGYGITGPGGNINIIAESNSTGSNILLSANSIQLDGGLNGTALNTFIPANIDDNHILTTKAVKTELDKKQDKLAFYSEVSGDTPSATISVANINLIGKVAEGSETTASGNYSHAEGISTTASSIGSHTEGYSTTASGDYSHTEGVFTTASSIGSHAEGVSTKASSQYQHVQGKYNVEDTNEKYADIIGNGTSENNRINVQTVSWNGISWSQTDVRAGGTNQDNAIHSLAAKQNSTDNNLTTIDKTIVGAINGLNTRIDNSSGMLYFTGGNNKLGTNSTFSAGEVFSVAYRTDFQFTEGSATANQYRPWSIGNPASSNISIVALADDRLRVSYNGGGFCSYMGSNIRAVIKTINDIVVIVTNPTGGNMNTSLYVNGVQIPQTSYSANPSLEMTGYRLNAMNYASSTIDTTMKDFAIFNFDMSAEDAPYSVADYSAGKPVPPSALAQTAVLLENYTFTVGSTQYIPDVSGNNHDITVANAGTVVGTFDKAIAKLASLITSINA